MTWWTKMVLAAAVVAAVVAVEGAATDQPCISAAHALSDSHIDKLVMIIPLTCSACILIVTIIVVFCVLKSEMKKLRQVEEAAFKVMDAVLRALLPDKLAEHLGCGIENLAPEPDKPADEKPADKPEPST